MSMYSNLKIRSKILILVAIPVIGMAVFAGIQVANKMSVASEDEMLHELADLAVKASALVHEQQKERGETAGFIKSKGVSFAQELPAQRLNTNQKKQELMEYLTNFESEKFGSEFAGKLSSTLSNLERMPSIRSSVDSLTISAGDAIGYYTSLNGQFLDLISSMLKISHNSELVIEISAYVNFLQGKERAGIERAVGAAGFAGGFSPSALKKFSSLINVQNTYTGVFKVYASPEQVQFYENAMQDSAVKEVEKMREIAFASGASGDLQGADAAYWFKTITAKINLLKSVEDKLSEDIILLMEKEISEARSAEFLYGGITLASLAIIAVLAWIMVRGITTNINGLTNAMSVLAKGDTSVRIKGREQKDEIGEMARAVEVFKESMINNEKMRAEQEQEQKAREERTQKIDQLTQSFDTNVTEFIGQLSTATNEMQSTAGSLSQLAEKGASQSSSLASATDSASNNVNTVASAAEELTASIGEINQQVSRSTEIARQAVEKAEGANTVIGGLLDSADKIGEVSALINDIAEQINLLALNATIEAARAGEAGKGFAVVASEVKNLATQTANATAEIGSHISKTQEETRNTAEVIKDIGSTINEMNEISTAISAAMEEQGAATQEIARSIQNAAQSTSEVSSTVSGVSESANQTGSAATEMTSATENLAKQSDALRSEVEGFLSNIKAA